MTDHKTYERFLKGDQGAFEEIVKTYRRPITYFILGYIRNEEAAEDIAAEVFAQLLIKKRAFGFRSSLKTYLFAIAKNKSADWLRKQKKQVPLPQEIEIPDSPEDIVFRDEKNRMLRRTLNCLREDYRQVLILLFFEEMTYEEAAKVLKKNKKQIDNLAYRAKQALKKELEKEGIEHA